MAQPSGPTPAQTLATAAQRAATARPARRRLAPELGALTVIIEGYDLPGRRCHPSDGQPHENVHVAVMGRVNEPGGLPIPGKPGVALGVVPGDAAAARWEVTVTVRRAVDGLDFTGPYVRGDRTDRNIGLAWGDLPGDGTLQLFRGAKLRLNDVDPALVTDALQRARPLVARVRLTDPHGNPICARLRPPHIGWAIGPESA